MSPTNFAAGCERHDALISRDRDFGLVAGQFEEA
jgi:hypothetical protein